MPRPSTPPTEDDPYPGFTAEGVAWLTANGVADDITCDRYGFWSPKEISGESQESP